MDAGLHICTFDWTGGPSAIAPTLAATARDAEAAGFRYVTMMDHFMQAEGFMAPADPIIEGYAGLSYLAAHTERVTLGMLVWRSLSAIGERVVHPEDRFGDRVGSRRVPVHS